MQHAVYSKSYMVTTGVKYIPNNYIMNKRLLGVDTGRNLEFLQ